MADKRKGPKPSIKGNTQKGRNLHASFLKTTKKVQEASGVFTKQSEKLINSISKAIEDEDQNLISIEKQLKELDKRADDYIEKRDLLLSIKHEAELKSKSLVNLSSSAESNVKLTEKLLKLVEDSNKDSYDDLIVENVAQLAEINKYLEKLEVDKEFDTEEILEQFGKIIDKNKLDKIEKRLEALDNYLLNPAKNIGLFSNLTDMVAGSIFGPLGKPLADALNLNSKLESNIEKIFKGTDELKNQGGKYEKLYEKLKEKLEESELPQEKKDLILKQTEHANERQQEIEIDRTQDFRSESLHLAQKTLDKSESSNFGVMQILSLLTGGKFVKGIAMGLSALLGGTALKGMMTGGLGGLTSGGAAGSLTKMGGVSQIARLGAPAVAGAIAWEIGHNQIGKRISDTYRTEINDAVWWAVEEVPEKTRKNFFEAKERAAERILNISTGTFNAISNIKTGYENLVEGAHNLLNNNRFFNRNEENSRSNVRFNTNNSSVTELSNSSINFKVPSVEKFPMKLETLSAPQEKPEEKQKSPMMNLPQGKISSEDIPMFTSDQKTLLLTTGNL